ncbi:MAG TPA: ABC-F family ATP-binding cassette domain-containing protein [Gaiellales bacterium]|nr:ABC-F family ATP-binding cassette domain-containing protein [Gaiellales bacterium]
MTVHVTSVALSYGADEVLADVSAIIRPRDRVALVGRNGAGKTTLLRLLAGELGPDRGEISAPPGTRVALHDQRPPLAGPDTLGSYVGGGAAKAERLEGELRELEARMAEHPTDAILRRYDAAQREFERAGGYAWRSRLEAVARGLGFVPDDLDRPLRTFSGGELTRASLVRALAAEPDILLLDEPTNHLDTDAIEWLESHLAALDAGVVFVSHDRWFLESVANGVLEIDRGKGRYEKGSYSNWRRLKAERLAAQAGAFERQQDELAHLQRFVDRFRYGTKARQAQSKLKAMARIERVERPTEQRSLRFEFPPPARSGRIVVEAERLIVEVAGRTLIADAGFAVERGQRVALLGPNGSGKTTLIETLLGRREPAAGRVKLGHNVTVGYYSQQSLELPAGVRMIDAVAAGTKLTGPQARRLLGRFLFSGDEVEKPVSTLSGGERRRLALARTVVSGANFLVLDEPTNHLDIESREALEDALLAYPGTILFVSHDRALIEALASRTLAIEAGRLVARDGGFGDYARAHAAPVAEVAPAPKPAKPRPARPRPAERRPSQRAAREAAKLERAIAALEEELGGIEARLSEPEAYDEDAALVTDSRRHQELQEELAYLYREWERHAAEAG